MHSVCHKVVGIVLFFGLGLSRAALAFPVVPNGDFESSAPGSPPVNWQNTVSFNSAQNDTTVAALGVGGSRALQLQLPSAGSKAEVVSDFLTLTPNVSYTVSFMASSSTPSGTYTFTADSRRPDGTLISSTSYSSFTPGYTLQTFTFTPTVASVALDFVLNLGSTGSTVLLDDVSISPTAAGAPELDARGAAVPLAMALGSLALLADRRRRGRSLA